MTYLLRNAVLFLVVSCQVCFSSDYDESEKSEMLILAASKGNQEEVAFFLEMGTKVDSVSDLNLEGPFLVCKDKLIKNATPFMTACAFGHLELAKFLVTKGADVKYANPDGYQATHVAAFNGYLDPVTYCVEAHGCDLYQEDNYGYDVIQACGGGKTPNSYGYLYKLLKNIKYSKQEMGLLWALEDNDLDGVKYCVSHGHLNYDRELNFGSYHPNSGPSVYDRAIEYSKKDTSYTEFVDFFDKHRLEHNKE